MRFINKKPATKIPCYVLIFDQVEIIKKSLDFLANYTDKLELVIIENPSPNTPEIQKMVRTYGETGVIKRYYLFDENITSTAFDIVTLSELALIKKSPFVLITDGDITSTNEGWLDEELRILERNSNVFACGISLDKTNLPTEAFPEAEHWIPPDIREHTDFYEVFTGLHLLLLSGTNLAGFLAWKQANSLNFVDANMHQYSHNVLQKKWSRTKISEAYHLTWDLYHDPEHPYTKLKTSKSHQDIWHHKRTSSFSLEEY